MKVIVFNYLNYPDFQLGTTAVQYKIVIYNKGKQIFNQTSSVFLTIINVYNIII